MNKKTQNSNQTSNQTTNQTQTQTQSNTYDWMSAPINAQTQKVLDLANAPIQIDPSINGQFGSVANQIRNSYNDPYGAYTGAGVKEKSLRGNLLRVGQEKAKARNQAYFDAGNQKFSQSVSAAALTQPQIVSTGGTSTGNSSGTSSGTTNAVQNQTGGFWAATIPSLIQGAAA